MPFQPLPLPRERRLGIEFRDAAFETYPPSLADGGNLGTVPDAEPYPDPEDGSTSLELYLSRYVGQIYGNVTNVISIPNVKNIPRWE